MINNPKVSIIIPIYNSEKHINKCLDSICNQTLKDIEIICVNDGSHDNSLKIISSFAQIDKRITIINQNNLGVSAARKKGLNYASADYIGFVDSDDFVEENYFEKLYNIAKIEHSDIIITGNIYEFNDKNVRKRSLLKYIYKESLTDTEKCKLFIMQTGLCNKIYKKTLIQKTLQYYEDNRLDGEDAPFLLFMFLLAIKVTYSASACYYYRINYSSISRKSISLKDLFGIYNIYNNSYIKLSFFQNKNCKMFQKYLLKRRNMHIYKKLCILPNLQQRIFFLYKTKDLKLILSCIMRLIIKNCLPFKIKKLLYHVYNNYYLRKSI